MKRELQTIYCRLILSGYSTPNLLGFLLEEKFYFIKT